MNIKWTYPNIIKVIYDKLTVNIIEHFLYDQEQDKDTRNFIQSSIRSKDSLSTNGARMIRYPHSKKKKNLDFILFTEIISKWIIDLHVKYKTIKFLEDIIGENLDSLVYGNNFLEYKRMWRDGIYWNPVYFTFSSILLWS